jgi:predicted TIM-barrel fold metal-dependent hydrolase
MKRRFVDAHIHLYDLSTGWYPALNGNPDEAIDELGRSYGRLIGRNYLLDDFRADAKDFDVPKVVHITACQTPPRWPDETRWLQGLYAREGVPNAIIGRTDLTMPLSDIAAELREHAQSSNFRGIRNYEGIDFAADHTFRAFDTMLACGIRLYDLIAHVDIHPDAARLAARFPDMVFVLEHAGWPKSRDADRFARWRDGLQEIARLPNTRCKISGLGMFLERWSVEAMRPWVLTCIEAFGVSRCMFASNFPVDGLFSTYGELVNGFEDIVRGLPETDQEALFAGNAEAIYQI